MHRAIANTLSKLHSEWASWISLWSFLVHLNDLDFYKELDEQLEICIAPSASGREGVHGKRSWPIEWVGERSVALNDDRVITGEEKKDIREQIDQAVEKLDIEVLLDPNMPHLGGMEVLARIKQDLSRNLHSMTPVKAA